MTDDFLIYLLFHMILFAFTLIGAKKIPILLLFVILGDAIIAIPTIYAFEGYVWFGVILLLINCTIPTVLIAKAIED